MNTFNRYIYLSFFIHLITGLILSSIFLPGHKIPQFLSTELTFNLIQEEKISVKEENETTLLEKIVN